MRSVFARINNANELPHRQDRVEKCSPLTRMMLFDNSSNTHHQVRTAGQGHLSPQLPLLKIPRSEPQSLTTPSAFRGVSRQRHSGRFDDWPRRNRGRPSQRRCLGQRRKSIFPPTYNGVQTWSLLPGSPPSAADYLARRRLPEPGINRPKSRRKPLRPAKAWKHAR